MSATLEQRSKATKRARSLPLVAEMSIEDSSPFGLQGLEREQLTVLKPDCVKPLAAALSLAGSRSDIRNPALTQKVLDRNPEWVEEYRIVHLIEKSLWFDGRCDFVMQMSKNPSQIPDNPPREIRRALDRAYTIHPEATVWYGVPVFGDAKNEEGLPIPLTALEVKAEADKRLNAARKHALRMGWMYRLLKQIQLVPARMKLFFRRQLRGCKSAWERFVTQYRQARRDAQRRSRAEAKARLEHNRTGRCTTKIPEHTTQMGQLASAVSEAASRVSTEVDRAGNFLDHHQVGLTGVGTVGMASLPAVALHVLPLLLKTGSVVACDPFLFIELPDEPGKLRMIGHWYWQPQGRGKQKLHVHV